MASNRLMADPQLTREILEKLSTDTVERGLGALTWSLCEGVFEEYGSPFWHEEKAVSLIQEFTAHEVSPWTGLSVMKRESSFANKNNNHDIDERNVADPFGVHFNENPNWPANAKKNLLLVADADAEYINKVTPEASVKGYRLPTFTESARRCAATLKTRGLVGYNPRREAYKAEIDDHLRQILRHTFRNLRLRDEMQRVYAASHR
jgi:hypothetical protein